MNWISVEIKFPNDGDGVLAKTDDFGLVYCIFKDGKFRDTVRKGCGDGALIHNPTLWFYVHEPPKD